MPTKHRLLTAFLLAGLLAPCVHADEQVRSVQEELRRRNIYFGDIDGQPSNELTDATKRYQMRKGFVATGQQDAVTLRSLGLLPKSPNEPPPQELAWPEQTVLKSDTKIDVAAEAEQIAAETGVAPASIEPGLGLKKRPFSAEKAAAITLQSSAAKLASFTPVSGSRKSGANRSTARSKKSSSAAEPIDSPTDQRLTPRELQHFVSGYIKAVGQNDLQSELKLYADRVSYYENGTIDRRVLERSLRRYYQQWPSRKYKIGRIIKITRIPSRGEIVVVFRTEFVLKNHGKKVRGTTDNQLVINAATTDPRIISIGEKRVRI